MAGPAERASFFREREIIRKEVGSFCPFIDVDEGIDIPTFQQLIGRDIIMGRIKADFCADGRSVLRFLEFAIRANDLMEREE